MKVHNEWKWSEESDRVFEQFNRRIEEINEINFKQNAHSDARRAGLSAVLQQWNEMGNATLFNFRQGL